MKGYLLLGILILSMPALAFLPESNHLTWWLYQLEACTSTTLPGTLPASFYIHYGDNSLFEGLCELITNRSLSPGRTVLSFASGQELRIGGMVAGELLDANGFQSRLGATLHARATLLENLYLNERLSLWTGSDELPPSTFSQFHQGLEKGRHFYVDWGYLSWETGPLELSLGRIPQRWGPGRFTQLLLSTNSPALDMLRVSFTAGDLLTFSGLTATVDSDSATYLVAHRLDITPFSSLRIGLNESILFRSEGLELAYMNPVVPWYPVQWNERVDDNAFMSIDAIWKPVNRIALYGEFLIDDIQYENTQNFPNKLGLTVGAGWTDPSTGMTALMEYTRIDRYVYSQRKACNYYLHDGRIIGSELGPDADRISFGIGSATLWPLTSRLTLQHTRHGEGSVAEGWPDSVQTGGSFPSGTIEYTTEAALDLSFYLSTDMEAHGSLSRSWIRNRDNVDGASDTETEGGFELIWRY